MPLNKSRNISWAKNLQTKKSESKFVQTQVISDSKCVQTDVTNAAENVTKNSVIEFLKKSSLKKSVKYFMM